MLVDRIVKSRFDSLEFERENEYRHPHCIIVLLFIIESFRSKKRRASRELHIKHPCTNIELIEESFDSISWLCFYSLCVDIMLMNVYFMLDICFYMLCM
jgi:hypothetical protein